MEDAAVRVFGDYAGFVSWVTKTFEGTILSGDYAGACGWAIPLVVLILGVLLITGLGTKWTLVAGELFMATLIVGMTLKQNWDTVTFQMIQETAERPIQPPVTGLPPLPPDGRVSCLPTGAGHAETRIPTAPANVGEFGDKNSFSAAITRA